MKSAFASLGSPNSESSRPARRARKVPMSALKLLDPSVADVFITNELNRRVPKKVSYLQEKLALQDLAARMADQPDEVLPRFVDLAMEMTGGVSSGLSLYEENPAPGVFRWQY